MVYSVFYYASEAITKAVVGFGLKVAEWIEERRRARERRIVKAKEREAPAPSWGFFEVTNPAGDREVRYLGRASKIEVTIPLLTEVGIARHKTSPPTRLYFTFREAASKDWFKEIEWLAEQAEKRGGGG